MGIIDNTTDEVVQKYTKEQAEKLIKYDSKCNTL